MSDNRARALEGEPDWALQAALKNPNVGDVARERVLAELKRRESVGSATDMRGGQRARDHSLPGGSNSTAPQNPKRRQMNQTEQRFAAQLEYEKQAGLIDGWSYEDLAVRIGRTRCFYHPDFCAFKSGRPLHVYEVKGAHIRDDARVKFEAAAKQWPHFYWTMVQWIDGEWRTLADYPPTISEEVA